MTIRCVRNPGVVILIHINSAHRSSAATAPGKKDQFVENHKPGCEEIALSDTLISRFSSDPKETQTAEAEDQYSGFF